VREALSRVPAGSWREFAAFAGPEMPSLTAWSNRVALVGDSSHALSGAFGSGAAFAMEDGWVLARSLSRYKNDTNKALQMFNDIRLPYYARMYEYLADMALRRQIKLEEVSSRRKPTFEEEVRSKIISDGGGELNWIYGHDIEATWRAVAAILLDSTC
jgi:salicylate hydroxylase